MYNDEHKKGMRKRTLRIFTSIKFPIHLYILQILIGIASAKIALLVVPYYSQMQTGQIFNNNTIVVYLSLGVLSVFFVMLPQIPTFYANNIVAKRIQGKLIHKILHLPIREFEQEEPATLISHVTLDVEAVNQLTFQLVGFITGFASTIMAMTQMSGINNFLSFIILPVTVYVFFGAWLDGKLVFLSERKVCKAQAKTTAFFSEHTAFLLNIKQMNAEKSEKALAKSAVNIIYKADIYKAIMNIISSLISGSTTQIIAILVFIFGTGVVRNGTVTIAELSEFYQYILIVYSNLSILPGLYRDLMQANGSLFYVGRILDSKEEQHKDSTVIRLCIMPLFCFFISDCTA